MMSAVYFARQLELVPLPLLKLEVAGSHAMSPAASITAAFVAVTCTRTVLFTSAVVSVYVAAVAFRIATHAAPLLSHRCHWYANVIGACGAFVPVQVPFAAVST